MQNQPPGGAAVHTVAAFLGHSLRRLPFIKHAKGMSFCSVIIKRRPHVLQTIWTLVRMATPPGQDQGLVHAQDLV